MSDILINPYVSIFDLVAEIDVEVGSFVKQAGTGNQDITIATDLTLAPAGSWAIRFWTAGANTATSGAWNDDIYASLGFVANGGGTISEYAMGTTTEDVLVTSNTSRRMAAKCITLVLPDGSGPYQEANFISFPDATTMRINWSSGSSFLVPVMYEIISGLTDAKVVNWEIPVTAGLDKAVTNVGFSPDLVLHAYSLLQAMPQNSTNCNFGFGMMNKSGQQGCNSFSALDAANPSNSSRWQQTDACLAAVRENEVNTYQAHFKSMNENGFTVNFSGGELGAVREVISLCMKGISSKIGAFVRSTSAAPAAQTIDSRQGFTPKGVLLSSHGTPPLSAPDVYASWSLGAYDGTNHRLAALIDGDAVSPTQADSVWYSNKAHVTAAAGGSTASATAITALGLDSFSVESDPSGASATEILYCLIGDPDVDTFPAMVA